MISKTKDRLNRTDISFIGKLRQLN